MDRSRSRPSRRWLPSSGEREARSDSVGLYINGCSSSRIAIAVAAIEHEPPDFVVRDTGLQFGLSDQNQVEVAVVCEGLLLVAAASQTVRINKHFLQRPNPLLYWHLTVREKIGNDREHLLEDLLGGVRRLNRVQQVEDDFFDRGIAIFRGFLRGFPGGFLAQVSSWEPGTNSVTGRVGAATVGAFGRGITGLLTGLRLVALTALHSLRLCVAVTLSDEIAGTCGTDWGSFSCGAAQRR
jgi:hypothetical protein